jgi:hypothetical protein
MALIAIGADKGAPGVTTTALALAAVWPRPVLLAECDPAGGDLVYRLPALDGGRLDPRRGVLSLAVAARRGMQSNQVWEQTQKLHGGLDVLTGVTNAEQGAGLNLLWGPVGKMLAGIPQADVIADCGRIGVDGPHYDLLAEATLVVLITRPVLGEIIRLRDRVAAVAAAAGKRGRRGFAVDVVVVADQKRFKITLGEVAHALGQGNVPARIVGAIADEPKSAEMLCGEWGGRLDKTLLIRTAREIAQHLAESLPMLPQPGPPGRPLGHEAWGQGAEPRAGAPSGPGAVSAPRGPGGRHAGYPSRTPSYQGAVPSHPSAPQAHEPAPPAYQPAAAAYQPAAAAYQPAAAAYQPAAAAYEPAPQAHQYAAPTVYQPAAPQVYQPAAPQAYQPAGPSYEPPSYDPTLPPISAPAPAATAPGSSAVVPGQIMRVSNGQISHEAPPASLSKKGPLPPWPASPPPPGELDQAPSVPLGAPTPGESANGQASNGQASNGQASNGQASNGHRKR